MLILLLGLAFAAAPSPGASEHETYYRYVVLGYLVDSPGRPRPGVSVRLTREKTGFSYRGTTDAEGLYVLVARLGDESVGERLALQAGADSVTITARFDATDHLRERGTRVDFVGGRAVERPAAFAATLRRFLER